MRKFYKIVRWEVLDDGKVRYRSPWAPTNGVVDYELGSVTRRNDECGPLGVYRSLTTAKKVIAEDPMVCALALFEVEIVRSEDTYFWTRDGGALSTLPPQTVLCDEVRPVGVVSLRGKVVG